MTLSQSAHSSSLHTWIYWIAAACMEQMKLDFHFVCFIHPRAANISNKFYSFFIISNVLCQFDYIINSFSFKHAHFVITLWHIHTLIIRLHNYEFSSKNIHVYMSDFYGNVFWEGLAVLLLILSDFIIAGICVYFGYVWKCGFWINWFLWWIFKWGTNFSIWRFLVNFWNFFGDVHKWRRKI